jgi:hypothetical protein
MFIERDGYCGLTGLTGPTCMRDPLGKFRVLAERARLPSAWWSACLRVRWWCVIRMEEGAKGVLHVLCVCAKCVGCG